LSSSAVDLATGLAERAFARPVVVYLPFLCNTVKSIAASGEQMYDNRRSYNEIVYIWTLPSAETRTKIE
jgi:hypothetical protein